MSREKKGLAALHTVVYYWSSSSWKVYSKRESPIQTRNVVSVVNSSMMGWLVVVVIAFSSCSYSTGYRYWMLLLFFYLLQLVSGPKAY